MFEKIRFRMQDPRVKIKCIDSGSLYPVHASRNSGFQDALGLALCAMRGCVQRAAD